MTEAEKSEAPGPSYFEVEIESGEESGKLFSKNEMKRFPKKGEVATNYERYQAGERGDICLQGGGGSAKRGGCIIS
tara:strand:+ start:287 stop:514 length:228 start_codon:yes stop_codon:yes gene_type:complete